MSKKILSMFVVFALIATLFSGAISFAADYTHGVTELSSNSAQITFTSSVNTTWVDVHYAINSGGQQNVRMTQNGSTFTQNVSGLSSGDVITYSFTYNNGAPAYDTPTFSYTFGSGGAPTPTATPVSTPTSTPTSTPASTPTSTPVSGGNVALGKTATASSVEGAYVAANAIDGNTNTRWSSDFSDPQWIRIDLGSQYTINSVVLNWEAAYGKSYQIQVSNDDSNWNTVYSTTSSNGGIDNISFTSTSARYVRMYGTERGTAWGYSLWEFEVYASGSVNPTPTPTTVSTPTPSPSPGSTPFWDRSNIPAAQNVMTYKFLNRTNGRWSDSEIYWSFNGVTKSLAEQPYIDMPANPAGRIYLYLGSPDSQYVDFIEHTISETAWYGNTTRVDWFGFPIALLLHCEDGFEEELGEDRWCFDVPRDTLFDTFKNEVPAEFRHLAEVQYPYKIICPGSGEFKPGGIYENYYTNYVNQVWATHGLTMEKPNTEQVFRCSGTMGGEPDIAAALNRGTAHLSQSSWTNSSLFYPNAPANYYAKFFHDHSLQNKAYGFAYDDVGGYAAYTAHGNPEYLLVAIGW